MSELTREQVEMELMQLLNGIGVGGNILAHDAALRAKVEALEREVVRLKDKWQERRTNLIEYYEAQLAAMKQERDEAERREQQWEHDYATDLKAAHAERDGQAMQIDALRTHLSATITEKDRLKEALEALEALDRMTNIHKIQDLDAHAVIHKALRGETGGG
jgi:chromosome segregation ATPase